MYKINGTEINLQPTSGRWLPRKQLGRRGDGHPVYSPTREFELKWQLVSRIDANQLQDFYDQLDVTGSVVFTLPKYRSNTWEFYDYSGCTIDEPSGDMYFSEYETDITLLVYGIVTE